MINVLMIRGDTGRGGAQGKRSRDEGGGRSYAVTSQEGLGLPRAGRGRDFPLKLQGGMALPTPWFWTASFQSYERTNFC